MTESQLKEVLEKHKKWLNNEPDGERANLRGADLQRANLRGANLQGADLQRTDLRGADLQGTDLDFSSGLPMWCYGLRVHIDDRIGIQLLYHAVSNILYSKNTSKWLKIAVSPIVWVCNKFHRGNECGELHAFEDTEQKEENEQ